MSTDQCQHMRTLLGMHALGRLDPTTTVALQAHLDGCRQCREELRELRAVGDALRQADPERVTDQPVEPPPALHGAVFGAVADDRRRQHRRRSAVLITAGAAAVVLAVALGWVFSSQQPAQRGRPVAFVAQPAGVHAEATVEGRNFGTSIALDVTGLRQGQRYAVWLESPDQNRMPAGSFIAAGEKKMSMTMAVGLPMSDVEALGVSMPNDPSPILLARLR